MRGAEDAEEEEDAAKNVMRAHITSECSHNRVGLKGRTYDRGGVDLTSTSYAGIVRKSSKSSDVATCSKSLRASGKWPRSKRAAPTSWRTRAYSSSTRLATSSRVTGVPSSSDARCFSHCQICVREISAVAASSIRL